MRALQSGKTQNYIFLAAVATLVVGVVFFFLFVLG